MHLLTKFLDWLFPWTIKDWPKELAERCAGFDDPFVDYPKQDALAGLDENEKEFILGYMTKVSEFLLTGPTPAIYDPENYPEGSKAADDYITYHDAIGVTTDAERIVPIKLDWNTGTAPKKKVKKVTKKKKTSKKKRK